MEPRGTERVEAASTVVSAKGILVAGMSRFAGKER